MSENEIKNLNEAQLDEVAGGRKSDLAVAYDVLNGRYGNGEERIRRLRLAGYDPVVIQSLVNSLVKNGGRDPYMDPPGTGVTYKDPYMG